MADEGTGWQRRRAVRRLARTHTPDAVHELALTIVSGQDQKAGRAARSAISGLDRPELVDAVCDALLETGDPGLIKLVGQAGYRHSHGPADAVVSFLTGDLDRYRTVDPDGTALREAHERAGDALRTQLAAVARDGTTVEWVRAVTGARPGALTDVEWSAIAAILTEAQQWDSLWRLVFVAPPGRGTPMVRALDQAGWTPEEDNEAFTELRRLVRASAAVLDHAWVPADGTRLTGVTGHVHRLAVTPDGTRVYVGTSREVRAWALPSGRVLGPLRDATACGWRLGITPDGGLLVTDRAASDGERVATVWELPAGHQSKVLSGPVGSVNELLVTPDGRFVAVGDNAGAVHLWHLPSGKPAGTLVGTGRAVTCLTASSDGLVLASGHVDGSICLWRPADGVLLGTLRYGKSVGRVLLPEGGAVLAVSAGGGELTLWDFKGARLRPKVLGDVIGEAALTRDSTRVVARHHDGGSIWRLPEGDLERVLPDDGDYPTMWGTLAGDGLLAGFGPFGDGVRLWELPTGGATGLLGDERKRGIVRLSASEDGRTVVTADADDVVTAWRLWDDRVRALARRPLADLTAADLRTARSAASLPGERAWLDLVAALHRRHVNRYR